MRTVWAVAGLALIELAAEAHADTLYLKDGQTVWGAEVVEEGETVVVLRPGEVLRFPSRDVNRIERSRLSIPRYYEPPTGGVAPVSDRSAPPSGPATAGTDASPAAKEPTTAEPPVGPPAAISTPAPLTPTRLPSPPPPPSAGQPR
jgi:hypothetical protein